MGKQLRALIVDDEAAARTRLSLLCAELAAVAVVGTASDGPEALSLLAHTPADLLFLDIEMPGMSGMALARELCDRPNAPAIVFVTAFDRFAVAAFGVNAAGYLLKPVDPDLLVRTVSRVARPTAPLLPSAYLQDIWVPYRSQLQRIPIGDVDRFDSEDDYVRLHTGRRSYLLSERLQVLEDRLDPSQFARIHRSTIVRLAGVVALRRMPLGAWSVDLDSGATLPVGRSYLAEVRKVLAVP